MTNHYNIPIQNFEKYITLNGWVKDDNFPKKNIGLFKKDGLSLVLPTKITNNGDFRYTLDKAIQLLSNYEERALEQIVSDIDKLYTDYFKFRIASENTKNGTIPLGEIKPILDGLFGLMKASIANEKLPTPYFRTISKEQYSSINNFRFGQTEVGSFIITVETENTDFLGEPEPLQMGLSEDFRDETFERKVMNRIQISMHQLVKAISNDRIDFIINDGYLTGLNGNMSESLLEMIYNIDYNSKFEFISRFSPAFGNLQSKSAKLTIPTASKEVLTEVSKAFKKLPDEQKKIALHAKVVSINSQDFTKDNSNRVILRPVDGLSKIKNLYVTLSENEYKAACDFIKNDQTITVTGTIKKEGNVWILIEHSPFKLI